MTKSEEQIKRKEFSEQGYFINTYNLKIPNREIRSYFGNMFINRFFGTEVKTDILIKALENGIKKSVNDEKTLLNETEYFKEK